MESNRASKGYLCPFKFKKSVFIFISLLAGSGFLATAQQQNYQLNGKVVSAEDLTPLSGAAVTVRGNNNGTATNNQGIFQLTAFQREIRLSVSLVGYLPLDTLLQLPLKNELIILLHQDATMLETAVVKGYYTTSKEFNTGSVSSISNEVLEKQPVGDPMLALQGRVPGLHISQTSGVPGAAPDITLRGRNSIANGNDPLYIIDGVPFTSESLTLIRGGGIAVSPFSSIGLDNIERIDVLKDADATAIYGSRGANGVILITTKKGQAGKTRVSVNFNRGFGKIVNGYNLMNTQEYLQLRREAFSNDGVAPGPSDYDLNGTWDTTRYTDWEEVIIGNTAQLTDANISLSGGSSYTQFRVSGAYRRETTVFPGDYRNRKLSVQSNISHRSENNRFNSSFTFNYTNDNNLLPASDLTADIDLAPNSPEIYNEDGSLNWEDATWANPFAKLYRSSTSITNNLNGALSLSYELIEGISVNTRVGYNNIRLKTNNLNFQKSFAPTYTSNARRHAFGDNGMESWIAEPWLNLRKPLGKGVIEAMLGATFQENSRQGMTVTASGFSSDALVENMDAATEVSIGQTVFSRYRYSAAFARLGYTLLDRYVINLTARRDGSSRFGPGKRFGNFGAVGAAWIFSREGFIQDLLPFLDFGKLKLSYGLTGNDQLEDYQYLSTYASSIYSYQGLKGLNPMRHSNPDFAWETVRKLEGGLEVGFMDSRFYLELNWYRNRTGNQLVGYPLPGITGFTSVQANLPAIVQNSGFECNISAQLFSQNQFEWSVSGNLSIPRNKLIAYPGIEASSYANRYVVGKPLSITYRYRYTGLDRETGIYTFADLNGDGVISASEDRSHLFAGQRYFGGLNNYLSFKGFELDIFVQFVKQTGRRLRPGTYPGGFNSTAGNLPKYYLSRWRESGDEVSFQQATQYFGEASAAYYSNYLESDATLLDASFLRLKHISLSWSPPEELLARIGLPGIKVFARAQNLFTVTNFQDADPEINASYVVPPLKMITAGVQLSIM